MRNLALLHPAISRVHYVRKSFRAVISKVCVVILLSGHGLRSSSQRH